jgi:hypothetical protein
MDSIEREKNEELTTILQAIGLDQEQIEIVTNSESLSSFALSLVENNPLDEYSIYKPQIELAIKLFENGNEVDTKIALYKLGEQLREGEFQKKLTAIRSLDGLGIETGI